jgi:Cu/Zn superoxide dismutase
MNRTKKWYCRRASLVALVVVLAAVAAPVAFAALAGNGSTVTLPMLTHDNSCGTSTGKKQIGKVTFSRHKDSLTITVDLTRAVPGAYGLETFYAGDPISQSCSPWGDFHKGKVGADGHLHMSYTLTGTDGYNDFAVYGFASSGTPYDDSGIAHLAGG